MPTDKIYHHLPYPNSVSTAMVAVRSDCGTIRVSQRTTASAETLDRVFRPDSPIYNVPNESTAGHVLIALTDAMAAPDVAVVTFLNTSRAEGRAEVVVAFNYANGDNQEQVHVVRELAPTQGVSVHITLALT